MKKLVAMFSVVVCCSAGLTGCGGEAETLSADAPHFEGLDSIVVAEIIDNPDVRQKIEEEPAATKESLAQGIAINFTVCRDALRVYQELEDTGVTPALNPLPAPINPMEPSHSDWDKSYTDLVTRADSGELEQLRFWLTANGSCGPWIPATPGDATGPSIEDVIEGRA